MSSSQSLCVAQMSRPVCVVLSSLEQVEFGLELRRVTIYLLINNTGTSAGGHLTQLSIRDTVSGLSLLENHGKVLEKGFLTFAEDSLSGMEYHSDTKAVCHRNTCMHIGNMH